MFQPIEKLQARDRIIFMVGNWISNRGLIAVKTSEVEHIIEIVLQISEDGVVTY